MLECRLKAESPSGVVVLDLVEGGKHFQCELDLATGEARFGIDGDLADHVFEYRAPSAILTIEQDWAIQKLELP